MNSDIATAVKGLLTWLNFSLQSNATFAILLMAGAVLSLILALFVRKRIGLLNKFAHINKKATLSLYILGVVGLAALIFGLTILIA